MAESILNNETPIRLGFFFGVLLLMALWELISPRRRLGVSKPLRWVNNLSLVFLNSLVLRVVYSVIFPVAALGTAVLAAEQGWGLLNALALPEWVEVVAAVLALDLLIYAQHVAMHLVPPLWRLHRMHHADLDIDVTTGARFHPIEIVLSMGIKMGAVVALGASPLAVLIFEVVLNATAMFNHANARLPLAVDRLLRLILVTPDMHRVHHSIVQEETNSNYGFNLPWWDRIFGTYRAQPAAGHDAMTIGIERFREPRYLQLHLLLAQPFIGGNNSLGETFHEGKARDEG